MEYITATELRTKTKELVKHLKAGNSTNLVYKSKIVGILSPIIKEKRPKVVDEHFIEFMKKASLNTVTTKKEREQIYRKHLMDKYGGK